MMLVQAVVGSVIMINRRRGAQLFPPSLRNLWKEWQLQGLILLSLTAQIVLVGFGNRRKYIAKTWVRCIVWLSYLLADSVATMALGVLSNDIGQVYWEDSSNSHASDYEITAFWAPFLLMHMGGMDTITAYSLEDNELWLRHSFTVVVQAVIIVCIFLMSWSTSSRLSPLFIVVFFLGLIKYCERVWALFSASEKRFRDSIPHIPSSESKIMEECKLRQLEGYYVINSHQVLDVPVFDESFPESDEADEIVLAHSFLEMVKRLFADLILDFQDRDASRAIFEKENMDHSKALKIIEIELGLIYDLMYTKATVIYSLWGVTRRIIGSLLILGVFVMVMVYTLDETLFRKNSSKIDLTITLLLLVVAVLLDLCAFAELFLSDQTAHWLIKHKKTKMLQTINRIRSMIPTNWGRERKRWSKTVEQFSLLSFCLARKKKPLFCLRILELLRIEEVVEIYVYKSITPPAPLFLNRLEDLPNEIFEELKKGRSWADRQGEGTNLCGRRGGLSLERGGHGDLEWSVKIEFEQSILVWHLATEICYQLIQKPDPNNLLSFLLDRAKCMSRYMLYLLVEHPNMLPIGIGQIKFRDLYSDLWNFIETSTTPKELKEMSQMMEKKASQILMGIVKEENMPVGGGERSHFVIFHGCKLASLLGKDKDEEKKWQTIVHVWMEMLGYAASQCKGRHHAQQLRRGGEYLTHLWLLMAHFGLTHHFEIPRSRTIAGSVLRWEHVKKNKMQ